MSTAVSLPRHQSFSRCVQPYWDRGWWRAMTTAPRHLSSFGPDRHFVDIPPSPGRTRSHFPNSVPAARTPHPEAGMVPVLSAEQAGRRHWRLKKHLMFHKAVGVRITLRSTLKPAVQETISALLFCLGQFTIFTAQSRCGKRSSHHQQASGQHLPNRPPGISQSLVSVIRTEEGAMTRATDETRDGSTREEGRGDTANTPKDNRIIGLRGKGAC
ncbi:hypothetical protein Q8A67_025583 [Cirrhinus molitorella]|uniref:Uncharacterized protein n=1 Tax=Cirrhinus molitorella TaxID=172907 RepID=A0AA88NUR3_9TELE|nr:hypothetical protein Q8A67_025583 [Cirrhinus molitorella]